MRELLRLPRWALMLGLPTLLAVLVLSVWVVDATIHRDRVVRNVKIAGETVGGLSDIALRARVDAIADRLADTQIVVQSELGDASWVASDLGISLDVIATFEAVMNTRRAGLLNRPIDWLSALTSNTTAEIAINIDLATLERSLHSNQRLQRAPIDPSIRIGNNRLELVPGIAGQLVDVEDAAAAITKVLQEGTSPTVRVATIEVPTEFSDQTVRELVAEANRSVQTPLRVRLNDYETVIAPRIVASWFVLDLDGSQPSLNLETSLILASLEELLMPGNTGAGQAQFEIREGTVKIISSDGGTACCQRDAVDIVKAALETHLGGQVHVLPNRPAAPREAVNRLEGLGIVEKVASFTTQYSCCLGRVTNIQKFAEIVSGTWVKPGDRLSLNEKVGRRTEEKGFVPGGFISKGHLVEDIGGGVSQFATTIFNAALRAGLDFEYYQAHSIYFERYPYGLEATISYPRPDLVITNSTPFGVLIWNSWTDESVTVDIYSTSNVEVILQEPTEEPFDLCTRVRTERIRTWQDRPTESDYFFATYRPEEGLNCDGTPSDPDQTTTTIAEEPEAPTEGSSDTGQENLSTTTTSIADQN
ncbi:MAG: VanW family protein [Candidatus Poriferisodalaceae bacterium]